MIKLILISICLLCTLNTEAAVSANLTTKAISEISQGNAFAKAGNYEMALQQLDLAIKKDQTCARAYRLRGHVHYALGDYQKAFQDLNQVVILVPETANAYCDRAIIYSMLGDHGAALTDIDRALKIRPDSSFAITEREVILQRAAEAMTK